MSRGTLEVLLVSAKGLDDSDFLCFSKSNLAVLTLRLTDSLSFLCLYEFWGFDVSYYSDLGLSVDLDQNGEKTLKMENEKKSSVASGAGSSPEWNETFLFTVSGGVTELKIKILDKDTFTDDDFVGEATIPLEPVFTAESVPPTSYSIVKDQEYCGEIRVGLKFTHHQESRDREFCVEEFGGWKESSLE
ncbi:Elicitor-responsive protein 3 [Sesamum angolense]|uniref:Elicitor-responsive protein 3 n=1 Tax=Sesamum angolense TaxID=2727404 RepID=A0AAE1T6I2_9LAMI|nr:Elicitor-responsive protein 3 [Sesamum angolense]